MDRYLLEAELKRKIPLKTVYLVRHGQSTHNAHALGSLGADLNDARYADAPLTPLGHRQAHSLAEEVARISPELVVTSPMTRATQTCLAACSLIPSVSPVVNQVCTERLAYSCDVGTPVSALRDHFPSLDYGNVQPDCWWWSKPGTIPSVENSVAHLRKNPPGAYIDVEPVEHVRKRVNDFRIWLLRRPESKIMVFAHGAFLRSFVGDNVRFDNAEMKKIIL
ncbi:putative phosphatase [Gracilariopsis chorda]|uniref:Putative phosphatase n=1 Tax=Gracilariopsis chorda TaxID=448386 RepID=A0A2V3J5G5_9FLOR|nr:putative phosphatase [Gracilariopsis chorda]|eukprot:PXF49553.1 putative phosphatase [Gracilariopsis chorda]